MWQSTKPSAAPELPGPASGLRQPWLLAVASLLLLALFVHTLGCSEVRSVCETRTGQRLGTAAGLWLIISAFSVWPVSEAAMAAVLRQSGSAAGVLRSLLPAGLTVTAYGLGRYADLATWPGADLVTVALFVAVALGTIVTLSVGFTGRPRTLALPSLRPARSL